MSKLAMAYALKKKSKKMSKGGKVSNETEEKADDMSAEFDDEVLDDNPEPEFPEDGNEHGDERVSRIMKKRSGK